MLDYFRERFPKQPGDSDFVHRQALKAKALDAVRGVLPAAALSNVGIYGTGQAYEALLLRMRAHPLPEARSYADLMLTELRKVIPSFLKRVDLTDRGVAASTYLAHHPRRRWRTSRTGCSPTRRRRRRASAGVELVDFDPDGEVKLVAAMLYPLHRPARGRDRAPGARPWRSTSAWRWCGPTSGDRTNRRHRPGPGVRAHRLPVRRPGRLRRLPRPAAPPHAHRRVAAAVAPPRLHPARGRRRRRAAAPRSTRRWSARRDLHDALAERFPAQAPYAVALAYRLRFVMQMNAREAMHLHRAAQRAPGPPRLPGRRPADAPAHRRAGRPPGRRRGDALRRPLARARARAPRRRAPRRAAPPVALTGPAPVAGCDLCHTAVAAAGRYPDRPRTSVTWTQGDCLRWRQSTRPF